MPALRKGSIQRMSDVETLLDRLQQAGVSVWLDAGGKLRIDKDAPAELKELVRANKQALIDVRTAQDTMNDAGMRIIRLPLGQRALAYPPSANLDEIRWAAAVLKLDSMPLVINDEGALWISYDAWLRRQPLSTRQDREKYIQQREAEEQARVKRRKRSA